jgi:hypothetical protein
LGRQGLTGRRFRCFARIRASRPQGESPLTIHPSKASSERRRALRPHCWLGRPGLSHGDGDRSSNPGICSWRVHATVVVGVDTSA